MCDILDKKGGQCTIAHILMLDDMCIVQASEVWFTQHAKTKKTDQTERNRYVEFKLPPSWRKTDILQGDD